jgi:hypothetical protein
MISSLFWAHNIFILLQSYPHSCKSIISYIKINAFLKKALGGRNEEEAI